MREIRRLLSSFLAFTYLILSVGIDLEAHYCHNDLASFSVAFANNSCECVDDVFEMSCCSTEETLIQFDQLCLVQQKLSTDAQEVAVENEIEIQNISFQKEIKITGYQSNIKTIGPGLYLLNSSFLHYG